MNLIHDAWIPVRRKNGEKLKIAPWEITDDIGTNKEIAELAAPRPDFNGALIQFIIGLLQTTCAPQNIGEWHNWFNTPPNSEKLKEKFKLIERAFNLDGDGPRFMQDLTLEKDNPSEQNVSTLLVDAPGDNTAKLNRDHFNKRDTVCLICENCVAMALYTIQINAPAGGPGHRVGLRGGGPLTTIVLGNTLWHTSWLNIIEENKFLELSNKKLINDQDKFPWLTRTRTSEEGQQTTSQDIHPAQLFWSMPKRLRLKQQTSNGNQCDLCGNDNKVYADFYIKNKGINYTGIWHHPLSPMYLKKENKNKNEQEIWLPVHQRETTGYKHWLGYVLNDNNKKRIPAFVVSDIINNKMIIDFRIWAFGYDMDNMKACCWYEGSMPVLLVEEKYRENFSFFVSNIIRTAAKIADDIAWHINMAVYNTEIEANKNKKFDFVKARFWEETEPKFYELLTKLRDFVVSNENAKPEQILMEWLEHLFSKAEIIFDDITQSGEFSAVDPGRVAKAWNKLKWKILLGDEIKEILGLPVQSKITESNKKRKRGKK